MVKAKTLVLVGALASTCACSKLAWSKLLHGPLVDDGRLLIPAIADIIFGEDPIGTNRGAFGHVVLAKPHRLFDKDELPTEAMIDDAVLSYFRGHAHGYPLEFVEDYRKHVEDTISVCFSQSINGVRIYGTAACAEVRHNQLLYAWHLFVVPPSICTQAEVSQERAQAIVTAQMQGEKGLTSPAAELNIAFIRSEPTLVWRVPVKREGQGTQTFFVHAATGRIAAITAAAYRPTDGSRFRDGGGAAQRVVRRE